MLLETSNNFLHPEQKSTGVVPSISRIYSACSAELTDGVLLNHRDLNQKFYGVWVEFDLWWLI